MSGADVSLIVEELREQIIDALVQIAALKERVDDHDGAFTEVSVDKVNLRHVLLSLEDKWHTMKRRLDALEKAK